MTFGPSLGTLGRPLESFNPSSRELRPLLGCCWESSKGEFREARWLTSRLGGESSRGSPTQNVLRSRSRPRSSPWSPRQPDARASRSSRILGVLDAHHPSVCPCRRETHRKPTNDVPLRGSGAATVCRRAMPSPILNQQTTCSFVSLLKSPRFISFDHEWHE